MRWILAGLSIVGCANGAMIGGSHDDASPASDATDDDAMNDAAANDAAMDASVDAVQAWSPTDPFVLEECTQVTWQSLAARFPPGGTLVSIPSTFSVVTRRRESCNAVTGCTPWIDGVGEIVLPTNPPMPASSFVPPATGSDVELRLENPRFRLDLRATGPSGEPLHFDCNAYGPNYGSTNTCMMLASATVGYVVQWHSGQDGLGTPSWLGQLCADGRYHYVTELPPYLTLATNYVQLAVYGQI